MTQLLEQDPRIAELLTMLTYQRPAGSNAEKKFRNRYILPLRPTEDEFGNLWVTVPSGDDSSTASPILFSSHTDTVHKQSGKQHVLYGDGVATAENANCLGADDTVGVWIMVNMIRADVPGTYVFHWGEEIGGVGSHAVAKHHPDWLEDFKFAIAFDRAGYTEVITHQADGRCASDAFALSMAEILQPLTYHPSDGGTFTDTMCYASIIPECANLGVGYHGQHTPKEWQDCEFAVRLLDVLIAADWSKLVCERKPGDFDDDYYFQRWQDRTMGGGGYGFIQSQQHSVPKDLLSYCRHYPNTVADFLEAYGFGVEDIEDYLWEEAKPALDLTLKPGLAQPEVLDHDEDEDEDLKVG